MWYFIEFGLFFLLEDSDSDHDMSVKVSTPCVPIFVFDEPRIETSQQIYQRMSDPVSLPTSEENIFSGVRRW